MNFHVEIFQFSYLSSPTKTANRLFPRSSVLVLISGGLHFHLPWNCLIQPRLSKSCTSTWRSLVLCHVESWDGRRWDGIQWWDPVATGGQVPMALLDSMDLMWLFCFEIIEVQVLEKNDYFGLYADWGSVRYLHVTLTVKPWCSLLWDGIDVCVGICWVCHCWTKRRLLDSSRQWQKLYPGIDPTTLTNWKLHGTFLKQWQEHTGPATKRMQRNYKGKHAPSTQ